MKPPHQHSRINLVELKAQIVKKLGPEGAKQYFYYLHRFLSLKLSKPEFNKLCLRILGRENIQLHNHFIRSILRNTCSAKAPPPPANHHKENNGISKQVMHGEEISSDGYQKNRSHINRIQASSGSPGFPNGGDKLLNRRFGDHHSSLGLNGKVSPVPLQTFDASARSGSCTIVLENGYSKLNMPDKNTVMGPPLVHHHHQHQVLVQQSESEKVTSTTVYSKNQTEPVTRNDEKIDFSDARKSGPIRAPLGLPLCSASVGGARMDVSGGQCHTLLGPFCSGALLESWELRERMEGIAACQGLDGVSVDCVNVLNQGLDSYLKGLIMSSIGIVGERSECELTKDNSPNKDQANIKLINGFQKSHQHQLEVSEQKTNSPVSLQDFRVAMELNPRQLGEDWPLLLEKLCSHAFE